MSKILNENEIYIARVHHSMLLYFKTSVAPCTESGMGELGEGVGGPGKQKG